MLSLRKLNKEIGKLENKDKLTIKEQSHLDSLYTKRVKLYNY